METIKKLVKRYLKNYSTIDSSKGKHVEDWFYVITPFGIFNAIANLPFETLALIFRYINHKIKIKL